MLEIFWRSISTAILGRRTPEPIWRCVGSSRFLLRWSVPDPEKAGTFGSSLNLKNAWRVVRMWENLRKSALFCVHLLAKPNFSP